MVFGCKYEGYCSDMTRTVVIGKANDKQKEIYNVVLEAQLAGLAAVYGGKLAADAAFAALRERKKAGRHPSLFCTVERMGIWTEMVRLSWASCRKNSQCGKFHAYVYL